MAIISAARINESVSISGAIGISVMAKIINENNGENGGGNGGENNESVIGENRAGVSVISVK